MSAEFSVQAIRIHPVKSLSAQDLDAVDVTPGRSLPNDRRFAISHKASRFDPSEPAWQPKNQFLNLMRHERLAQIDSRYDTDSGILTLARGGRPVAKGDITTPVGRDLINQFLSAFVGREARGAAKLVELTEGSLADRKAPYVSIISATTVRDLERVVRRSLDPRRFRGNLVIAGAAPWAELDWIGKTIAVGEAKLTVVERIGRCEATNVNPDTAERDTNIPKSLLDGYGHADCGVLALVEQPGKIRKGDAVTVDG